jgi:methylthioribose-1-phosphate isomerase
MAQNQVDAIFVGSDRVAQNGDIANKIGTLGLAVLAQYFGIPFYVCAPSSTIDTNCPNGEAIVIEQRPAAEVTELMFKERMAPENINVYNPSFDVTPHQLITAIITEHGVLRAPYRFK